MGLGSKRNKIKIFKYDIKLKFDIYMVFQIGIFCRVSISKIRGDRKSCLEVMTFFC